MKFAGMLLGLLFLGMVFAQPTSAQTRYATCDLCGFCISPTPAPAGQPPFVTPPSTWESCRNCLYPDARNAPASSFQTLQIKPDGTPVIKPQPGRYYTMIGCINTNVSEGFSGEGAAGSVVQRLLSIAFSVAGGIAFLYLLWGAFLVLTSQADPERLNHGKRTIYGAIIGVIFVVSAVFIVNILATTILKIPGFTPSP